MDYSYDPCKDINSIDFDNPKDLKKVLSRDKHTRIEGICTEAVFLDDLVNESFDEYSTGWWFPMKNHRYNVVKILTNIESITDLDKKILSHFIDRNISPYIVSFDKIEKVFHFLKVNKKLLNDFESHWDEMKDTYPRTTITPPIPSSTYRSNERLEKAVNILESLGLLQRSAVERVLANCWIKTKGLWDIDTFVILDNQLIGLEVKQKYPTRRGTFGLNTGLSRLFRFLNEIDIRIVHVILTKPSSNKKTPATDYYTLQKYEGKSLWIGTEFSDEVLSSITSSAPTETSIFASQRLNFHHISPTSFTPIKLFGRKSDKSLLKFLNNELDKMKNIDEIPSI